MTRWRAFRKTIVSADPRLSRAVTALALLSFAFVVLLFAELLLLPATIVVLLLAGREWAHLAPREEERDATALLAGLLLVLLAYYVLDVAALLLLPLFLPVSLLSSRFGQQHSFAGLCCLASLGVGFVSLYDRFAITGLGWAILVVVAFDMAALFGGKMLRGPKLCPRISPDKRWAGLLCGLCAATFLGTLWLLALSPESHVLFAALASLLVALGAQAGDLAESQMKRRVGVKDTGALLPGHGGVLDRIDSLLCAVPVAWMALSLNDFL